jgi:hypothetical protein
MVASRKMLKSVIRGFLGTYVSRYSEFDGDLLFGFVVDGLTCEEIDLMVPAPTSAASTPHCELSRLARHKFQEQLSKVGLPMSAVHSATLKISKGEPRACRVNRPGESPIGGFDVSFKVRVVTDLGRVYEDGVHECIFAGER